MLADTERRVRLSRIALSRETARPELLRLAEGGGVLVTLAYQDSQGAVLRNAVAVEVDVRGHRAIESLGLVQSQRLEHDRFRKRARRVADWRRKGTLQAGHDIRSVGQVFQDPSHQTANVVPSH